MIKSKYTITKVYKKKGHWLPMLRIVLLNTEYQTERIRGLNYKYRYFQMVSQTFFFFILQHGQGHAFLFFVHSHFARLLLFHFVLDFVIWLRFKFLFRF